MDSTIVLEITNVTNSLFLSKHVFGKRRVAIKTEAIDVTIAYESISFMIT